jgi:hypothetical protein
VTPVSICSCSEEENVIDRNILKKHVGWTKEIKNNSRPYYTSSMCMHVLFM